MKQIIIGFLFFCIIIPAKAQSGDVGNFVKKRILQNDSNYIENDDYYQFEQYEKLSFVLKKLPENFLNQDIKNKKFNFLFDYIDTTNVANGKSITFALRETLSDEYRNKKNDTKKSIIKAINHEGLDEKIQSESIDALRQSAFEQINIFNDEINLLFKQFISPISKHALSFYDYEIKNDTNYNDTQCVRLSFMPKNPYNLCFTGELWIEADSTRNFIRKVILHSTPEANINFITGLEIVQEFNPLPSGILAKTKDNVNIHFSIFKLYYQVLAKNERSFKNYNVIQNEKIKFSSNNEVSILPEAGNYSEIAWKKLRYVPLSAGENKIEELNSDLEHKGIYNIVTQLFQILFSNYAHTGKSARTSKFDIGPVWSMLSSNDVEGFRFRLGGRTTAKLNDRFFLKGYGAYGTKDKLFKYSGTATYSLTDKLFHENEYPKNNFSLTYQYDTRVPGQTYFYAEPDNFFFSFKRGNAGKMTYKKEIDFSYEKEYTNGFYWKIWNKSWDEKAAGVLRFQEKTADGDIIDIDKYKASEIGLSLRFAFNEKFYPGRDSRIMLMKEGPVFALTQSLGLKKYLGGEYNYYFAEFSVQKKINISVYGYLETILKTGRIWGEVPFPLLILPDANQTYAILPESYSLMNALEFINDKYVSADLTYKPEGYFFNHIPYIQRLKLREVLSFKALYGGLSKGNNPDYNPDLFLFPENSYQMNKQPYMEMSFGIENIFKILRLDYVRRLTYLNNAGIDKNGIRVTILLSF